jgi:hypothetical protein
MEYVKETVLSRRINGKYVHTTKSKIKPLLDELNELVESRLKEIDLEKYKSKSK